ncbi:MAG: DNA polymerase III subunit beta [Anaerolineales bacterium]|nr:DNA polymerase III subunit beta [Anaerolineales bacterium]MCB8953431.1 DNA polymerase III subunit beta [Ardenticatenales bacterium]
MKVSCLQENLARGLSTVARAVSTRSTLPVLSNVLLATDSGRLKLSATNLEIVITCWIGAKVAESGAITVPARTLSDLVNALPAELIELNLEEQTQTLHLACARTEANIKGIDAQEFPLVPEPQADNQIRLDTVLLKQMISQVAFAAASDDTRPILTGVATKFEGSSITMSATDSFRLSVRTAEFPGFVSEPISIIIPARALNEVARVAPDDVETITLSIPPGRNQVIFDMGDAVVVSQLIDGTFPDVGRLVPDHYLTRTVMGTAEFLKACKTANIFARESSNTARVQVSPGNEIMPGYATIAATSAETGDNIAQVDASVDGEQVEIAFNVKYMTDLLNVIDTPQVALETRTAREPGVLKPVGYEGFRHVIMPMHFGR